jgi:hypothetical protein
VLLPLLPVSLRQGSRGVYFQHERYLASAVDMVTSLSADRGECDRRSPVQFETGSIVNEITVYYRQQVGGSWGASRTLAANASSADDRIAAHPLCRLSQARYERRPGTPIELPWVWETATASRVAQDRLERDAFRRRRVTYGVRDGESLRVGDVVLLSDSEVGLSSAVAIVAEDPLIVPGIIGPSITFRIPGAEGL